MIAGEPCDSAVSLGQGQPNNVDPSLEPGRPQLFFMGMLPSMSFSVVFMQLLNNDNLVKSVGGRWYDELLPLALEFRVGHVVS